MLNTILQYTFILIIVVMILGIVAPGFYHPQKKQGEAAQKTVLFIDNANPSEQEYMVNHLERLPELRGIAFSDVVLVAAKKGIQLLEKDGAYSTRLSSLLTKGIQVYACEQALLEQGRKSPTVRTLLDGVRTVADGRQYLDVLMDEGYVLGGNLIG